MTPADHPWFACRPALIGWNNDEPTGLGLTRLDRAWATLTDAERHRFHRYCCEGDTSPAAIAAVNHLREELRRDR